MSEYQNGAQDEYERKEADYLGETEYIDDTEMPEYGQVYLIDVYIDSKGGTLSIEMGTDGKRPHKEIGGKKIDGAINTAALESAVDAIVSDWKKHKLCLTKKPKRGFNHRRRETSMSFNAGKDSILVLRLANPNAYFTRETHAVKKPKEDHSGTFDWFRRLDPSGQVLGYDKKFKHGDAARNDRTKMVAISYKMGEDPHLAQFNLMLDILDGADEPDTPYVPIIVDPDVRFPGGSGEP